MVIALESTMHTVSLYETVDDGSEKMQMLIDKLPSKYTEDDHVDLLYLKSLIKTLPKREQLLINLRYFKDKTQGEVAEILGVSQVQVSRLENKIIKNLKDKAL